jgi:hypothetical protein
LYSTGTNDVLHVETSICFTLRSTSYTRTCYSLKYYTLNYSIFRLRRYTSYTYGYFFYQFNCRLNYYETAEALRILSKKYHNGDTKELYPHRDVAPPQYPHAMHIQCRQYFLILSLVNSRTHFHPFFCHRLQCNQPLNFPSQYTRSCTAKPLPLCHHTHKSWLMM